MVNPMAFYFSYQQIMIIVISTFGFVFLSLLHVPLQAFAECVWCMCMWRATFKEYIRRVIE